MVEKAISNNPGPLIQRLAAVFEVGSAYCYSDHLDKFKQLMFVPFLPRSSLFLNGTFTGDTLNLHRLTSVT